MLARFPTKGSLNNKRRAYLKHMWKSRYWFAMQLLV